MKKNKKTSKSEYSTKPKTLVNENSWRDALAAISINDENWWCIVTMMVETITEHSRCVSLFNAAAEEGRRKAIYSLSCQKMLASVRALSKQSLDKCPTIQGICHYASNFLNEDNEALPSWLMAQIIKYFIYRTREESIGIVKKLADLEREIDEEYWIMQTVADWGQPGSKNFNMDKFNNKANTKLRKRDEEWRDKVYVDDAPINGPNMYIILTGFHDPDLPQHLINNGVPLHCMLQIKRPNEQLDRLVQYEAMDLAESRKLQFLDDYIVNRNQLFNFWTKVDEYLLHPETYPEFCDVGFVTFCPPEYPESTNDDEYSSQKKDMYCRVSYIVYDFYDIYRQHGTYLQRMKVETGIISEAAEKANVEVYEKVLDSFPLECVSVPLILFAILTQVEANEKNVTVQMENSINENRDANIVQNADPAKKAEIVTQAVEIDVASPAIYIVQPSIDPEITFVKEKIKSLNDKFDLDDDSIDESEQEINEIELTLHGNTLLEAIRLLDNSVTADIPNANNLIDNVLSVFWPPNIVNLYDQNRISEKKLNEYTRHLDNIRYYFEEKISVEEIRHYLHALMFDRMIYGITKVKHGTLKATPIEEIGDSMCMQDLSSLMKRCKSLPSLTSRSRPELNILSDGNIDYGKVVPEIIECSPLFDLIDPRELLIPGYLNENIFKARTANRPRLEDFNDVELLSRPIFLQLLHECLLAFDHAELRYFEPTDCLLLYLGNKWEINGVSKEESMSSIRTPVRLRDFCKYVVPEEKDWLRREEELYRLETAGAMDRLTKKSMEIYDETMLFRDEDFILPGSLKARDLGRSKEGDRQKVASEIDASAETVVKDAAKGIKKGIEKILPEKEMQKESRLGDRKTSSKKLPIHQDSPSSSKKVLTEQTSTEEPPFDFVGYDLGRLRVQITNNRKTFYSSDDTLVQIEIDNWLYQCEDIRATITVHDYSLRLFHRIGSPEMNNVFHLTSKTGIILSFQKRLDLQRRAEIRLQYNWRDMNVQFRASWPTGLMIQPIVGDGPQNPYYIQQSYIPKGLTGTDGNREVCRKFLRNGTVLKYLDNDNIIVLRPNGVIVTCTAFEKLPVESNEIYNDDINISKTRMVEASGDRPSRESKPPSKKKKRPTSSSSQLDGGGEGLAPSRQNSTTFYDSVTPMLDYKVKVSRYTVLNHDGARYEVANDLIVSEQHRLLVRMASDYEVDEKFTRRADGTNMLLNSNGELIVRFPDGTRITTGYTIEKEPVMCDWTEEDVLRYFTSDGVKDEEEPYVDVSFFNLRYNGEASSRKDAEFEEKIAELLITDSFVSVLLTCRMEHKNYTTVFYDQSAVSCTLSMPDDLRVSISGRGDYEVSMAAGVNLKINEDTLSFKGNSCTICGCQSESIYNFLPLKIPSTIFHTTDVFGNTFKLKNDGTTHLYPTSRTSQGQTCNSSVHSVESDDQRERYEAAYEEGDVQEPRCLHKRLFFKGNNLGYRIFSIDRNLTAYEYIHRSIRNQAEMMAAFDNETSIILYPSSRRSKLQRLITCEPVGDVSRSKSILSFPDKRVKPTNFDRRDLLRSTYSIPYDWLFPFGRNGDGVWKNSHDQPLMEDTEILPKLLRIRILRGFKEPGGNAVIDLQRALGRYWMSIVCGLPQPSIIVGEEKEVTEGRRKSIHDHLEDKLFNLALGIEKTIDVETYKIGLQRPWKPAKPRPRRRSLKFDEYLLHEAEKEEQLQRYKRCMREKFILPYFQNITGKCFLWVIDCIKNALDISIAKLGSCENCSCSPSARENTN